jgi:predicted DNA-binding protein
MSPGRRPQGSAISRAIDEIAQIVEALKRVLNQMEDVLELAELAERQKTGDEQEIESLRRALRQLQRPGAPRRREDESKHSTP